MKFWNNILNTVANVKVRGITESLFKWGTILFIVSCVLSILQDRDWVIIIAFSLSGLLLIVGTIITLIFSKKNPDYLRSESYQIRKQVFEYFGDNENAENKNLQNIVSIMKPGNNEIDDDENPLLDE